jgi:BMFP domain-containing protein YqiC
VPLVFFASFVLANALRIGYHKSVINLPKGTFMFDTKSIDDIANRLAGSIPPGLHALREDLEKNFRAVLQSAFAKMDLVTREEFEVQKGVLAKTRQKLEALEARVHELENRFTDQ